MRNLYDEFDDLPEDEKAESESMESTESTGPTIYILPGATIELRRSRRVNVSFAKLQMLQDLQFSETVYGLGAGIFFIGYFLFEQLDFSPHIENEFCTA